MQTMRCVFFDRDGIVNVSPGAGRYVTRWEDFQLLPEFVETLRVVRAHGYQAVIVTNQRAVARGLVSAEEVETMHKNLREQLRKSYRLDLLDVACCPHDIGQCDCRKPAPGMLIAMATSMAWTWPHPGWSAIRKPISRRASARDAGRFA